MQISLIIPSRNNLKYLKWSYESIRKHQGNHTVQVCVADDASNDGTREWLENQATLDSDLSYIVNESGQRLGHTILYDRLVNEVAKYDLCMIYHADMFLCPGALDVIEKHMYAPYPTPLIDANTGQQMRNVPITKTIVSLTRIEPPLHPPGPEKIIQNFGVEPEDFEEDKFLEWYRELNSTYQRPSITEGIFAPWAFWKSEFQEIGGHDSFFAPQSKEDSTVGETLVFYVENGITKLSTIAELWEKYKQFIRKRNDGKEYIDLRDMDIRVMSPSKNGTIGVSKLRAIIRHKVTKNRLRRIKTKWGEVVVTNDHSLIKSNLEPITADECTSQTELWEPIKHGSWVRRNQLTTIDFNDFGEVYINEVLHKLPVIYDIDEYGNSTQLHDICEFLGFFCADGGAYKTDVLIRERDFDVVNMIKQKSEALFGDSFINYRNTDGIHTYRTSNSSIAQWLKNLLGNGSYTKCVPEFIFNLPLVYQKSFLYGYLLGDGHLGKSIVRNGEMCWLTIDPLMLYGKDSLSYVTWKSTSVSEKLTTGIYFLLMRCFPEAKFRVRHQESKGKTGVWNISSVQTDFKDTDIEILLESDDVSEVFVYDLDVRRTNMFIGGTGFIALHNSDIFNRFHLNGTKFIQTWEGHVYHMTCRGSRYNPTLTTPGKNSQEWEQQNIKSTRNFIRKWGCMVKHDEHLKPIVPPRYHKTIVLTNATMDAIAYVEPFCDLLLTDMPQFYIEQYVAREQPNTMMPLASKIKFNTNVDSFDTDVVIYIDMHTSPDLTLLNHISELIVDAEPEELYTVRGLKLKVSKFNDLSNLLIKIG